MVWPGAGGGAATVWLFGGLIREGAAVPPWQSVVPDVGGAGAAVLLTTWNLSSCDGLGDGCAGAAAAAGNFSDTVPYHLPVTVPGDVLTDLMRNGIIPDPYFDRNFLTHRHVWLGPAEAAANHTAVRQRTRTWTYSKEFRLPSGTDDTRYLLVAEGIKMGARLWLNGMHVGTATNQFRRHIWKLPAQALRCGHALQHRHQLQVVFEPNISTDGRFMACSGGWDWAPYSRSIDSRGSRVFTFGIQKPVYLVAVRKAFITDVVPRIYYQGEYPTEPMWDGPEADFHVFIHVFVTVLDVVALHQHTIVATFEFNNSTVTAPLSSYDGEKVVIDITVSKNDLQLWWPSGLGHQKLYSMGLTLDDGGLCRDLNNCQSIRRRVGFRTVALVTDNETDPQTLKDMKQNHREGSGLHGMYFRVNGAIIWARGANFVPMDQLEGRLMDEGHVELVRSAIGANMNMLRVWGGGYIPPKAFYQACDEYGLLIYQDLMFVEEGKHGAVNSSDVAEEITHIIRQLSTHPSIVLWNGCNECSGRPTGMTVYETFVMEKVAMEDDSRPVWASSPLPYGWETGVSRLDGHPNGKPLKTRAWNYTNTDNAIESHGPYQRGYSSLFPAINGGPSINSNETLVPPYIRKESESGPAYRNTFVSEFGASLYSSFDSMAAFLPESAWGVHGGSGPDSCTQVFENENDCVGQNPMAERNYPCDNRIHLYFGNFTSLEDVGAAVFQRQLYECIMAQTLWMKGRIEMIRASNSFGALIWQLNENWPTGGWGSIEYGVGSKTKSDRGGGRWKPLMFLLKRRLYRDSIVVCGQNDLCYAKNDGYSTGTVSATIEAWQLQSQQPLRTFSWDHSHEPGHSMVYFHLPDGFRTDADVVLLRTEWHNTVDTDALLWELPRDLPRLGLPVLISLSLRPSPDAGSVLVELSSDSVALYVVLTTALHGQFSDNAFHLQPNKIKRVSFEQSSSDAPIDFELLRRTLRIHHLGPRTHIKENSIGMYISA